MITATQRRRALYAMFTGLALTVAATVAPYVDRATGNTLAEHIRDGYPDYSPARVDSAVTTWLVVLTVIGALGVVGWAWGIWAVETGKGWARWATTAMFVVGATVALAGLLVKDTSGDVGLTPLLGWIDVLPCVPGLAAVTILWRGGHPHSGAIQSKL